MTQNSPESATLALLVGMGWVVIVAVIIAAISALGEWRKRK